jgi:DNA-3-methyladenine glycosylase
MRVVAKSRFKTVASPEADGMYAWDEAQLRPHLRRPLPRGFYSQSPQTVARELLGRLLVSELCGELVAGIIVETESYLATRDSACHGSRGRTPKSEVMFGEAGVSYVYPIHAKYCFNVVTETINRPSAVLIRAIQPLWGIKTMEQRRSVGAQRDLARGPARLCQALAIDRRQNGLDLTLGRELWIDQCQGLEIDVRQIRATPRIGVTSAKSLKLRFIVAGNPFVSGPSYMR